MLTLIAISPNVKPRNNFAKIFQGNIETSIKCHVLMTCFHACTTQFIFSK